MESALADASDDERTLLLPALADLEYFRRCSLTRACLEHRRKGDHRASELSARAHESRKALADTLTEVLKRPRPKKHVVRLRLALVELSLARFKGSAESFHQLMSQKRLRKLASGGATEAPGSEVDSRAETRITNFAYFAFAAESCLAGQWAEDRGDLVQAREIYQSFLTWTEQHQKDVASQDNSFLKWMTERHEFLESSMDQIRPELFKEQITHVRG